MRNYDGKTAAERTADRRRRLIDAGFALFAEHGYAGTSIRAVLRKAGLQDRYFAENFADLDALLAAVYDQIVDDEVAMSRAVIATTGGGIEGAREMIDALSRGMQVDPGRARIKLREVISAGPASRQQRQKGFYRLAALLVDLLPPVPPGSDIDPLLLAVGIVAAANEMLISWLDNERQVSRHAVVDLVALMFEAVAVRLTAST